MLYAHILLQLTRSSLTIYVQIMTILPNMQNAMDMITITTIDSSHESPFFIYYISEQVKARGAKLYIITDTPKLAQGLDPNPIIIPSNGPLTALTAVLPLQVVYAPLDIPFLIIVVQLYDNNGVKRSLIMIQLSYVTSSLNYVSMYLYQIADCI